MRQPFFSVIIPVYNRADILRDAVASVLAQTCQDFEIVVVDDGSRDDPAATVAAFADPRLRFFRQDNAGGGAARNRAIDEARGRFIAPLDSDDIFLPHHLAALQALLDGTTRTAAYARIRVDRGQDRVFLKPPRALREDEDMAEYLLCDRGFVPTISLAVETQAARDVRYADLPPAEDTDFAIRLFHAGVRFVMAQAPGAVWRDTADPNRSSASRNAECLRQWLEAMKPALTARAWHGGRGWAYAKLVRHSSLTKALGLYLGALLRGCYRPRLAAVILLQILLSDAGYRRLADGAIAWARAGVREKPRAKNLSAPNAPA
jgi:glycosyltransferase involved in cell wall biosynthesis